MSFDAMKERAVRYLTRKYLNDKYEEYGTMTRLEIDSQNRTIHAELVLKGETQPIVVDVNGYELVESSGKTLLRVAQINVSREWINIAFQRLAKGKEFEVPEFLRILL